MSIYLPSQIGTDTNQINFNNFTTDPIFRLKSRQPQRRQVRELNIPIPFENGIADFETLIGQTVYILEGTMYPGSEYAHGVGLAALRKLASLEISQDDILSDYGYVPYQWDEYNVTKMLYVKVLYVQLIESTKQGLVQDFRLICKVKDPTIYGQTQRTASTATATPSTSTGSAIYSFIYPIIYGASTYSVTADAYNSGDLPTYPTTIRVIGPVNSPIVTNTTTGEYIRVGVNVATVSNELLITYDRDTLIVTLDGVNVLSSVTSGSIYFKLQPGSNSISLTGTSISDGAYAEVVYHDAWPLS